MKKHLVLLIVAASLVVPALGFAMGFTVLYQTDGVSIIVSEDLVDIHASWSVSYDLEVPFIVEGGGSFGLDFQTDEPLSYQFFAAASSGAWGFYDHGHAEAWVEVEGPSLSRNIWSGTGVVEEGVLLPGRYSVASSGGVDFYGNDYGFEAYFSCEAGAEFTLSLRPLPTPEGGSTLALLGLGLAWVFCARHMKLPRNSR